MGSARTDNREVQRHRRIAGIAIGRVRITNRTRVSVVETAITEAEIPDEVTRLNKLLPRQRPSCGG